MTFYRRIGKRVLDVVIVLAASPVVLALTGVVWLLVRARMGGPALFNQVRPGLRGQPFVLRKFRTMDDTRDEVGRLLPDAQRLTSLGRWLRASSLDELPQLWNVLRGDMSLVGPRPLLVSYLDRYDETQARRHDVRPGVAGWAQVNGRNQIDWDSRLRLDVWYVDNLSFQLDMMILWRTIFRVLSRHGVSTQEGATMPEFVGGRSHRSADDDK
jgi:sugar transferase EpsL